MKFTGVKSVEINLEEQKITTTGYGVKKKAIVKKLTSSAHPEKDPNTSYNQAKSFLSCAVEKMS